MISLAHELRAIEKELGDTARKPGSQAGELLDGELLAEVRAAIDRIRNILWPFVEAAARRTDDVDHTLQRYRMQRVTDMLEGLKERVGEAKLAAAPEAPSFFANIQEIATTAVERHLEHSAPSTSSSSRKPASPQAGALHPVDITA